MNFLRAVRHSSPSALLFVSLAVSAAQTPANKQPPAGSRQIAAAAKSYSPDLVQQGRALFRKDCSFCHGRDAGGGETGPDLTRSKLVAADVDGDKIGPVVRNGRPDKGMPPFDRSDQEIASLVAFIHTQQANALASQRPRRQWRSKGRGCIGSPDWKRRGRQALLRRCGRMCRLSFPDWGSRRSRNSLHRPRTRGADALSEARETESLGHARLGSNDYGHIGISGRVHRWRHRFHGYISIVADPRCAIQSGSGLERSCGAVSEIHRRRRPQSDGVSANIALARNSDSGGRSPWGIRMRYELCETCIF